MARRPRPGPEPEPVRLPSGPSAASAFPEGCRVRHPQFGEGTVTGTSGSGSNARVTVNFRGVGRKTLVLEYARLKRVG